MESYRNYGRGNYGRGNNPYCGCNQNKQPQSNKDMSSCAINKVTAMMNQSGCDCSDNNKHMKHMPLAMAYVPVQNWGELYDPETALCEGTAFPDLNLIFCGGRGKK